MAKGTVTLKERHPREMDRMANPVAAIDAALQAYARRHGGRLIRFASTAEGHMRRHSDVDIIADVPGEASLAAADFAGETCLAHGMTPHAHAGADPSPACKAERRGLVIACWPFRGATSTATSRTLAVTSARPGGCSSDGAGRAPRRNRMPRLVPSRARCWPTPPRPGPA